MDNIAEEQGRKPRIDWSGCPAVESVEERCGGSPVLRGTRLPVVAILNDCDDRCTPEQVAKRRAEIVVQERTCFLLLGSRPQQDEFIAQVVKLDEQQVLAGRLEGENDVLMQNTAHVPLLGHAVQSPAFNFEAAGVAIAIRLNGGSGRLLVIHDGHALWVETRCRA